MNPAAVAVSSPLATLSLAIASTQVGQREQPLGSNRGPMVDKYILSIGLDPTKGNYPWCQAFAHYCVEQASLKIKTKCPCPRTGGVLKAWNASDPAKRISAAAARANPSLVKPGAQFFLKHSKTTGHTGFVEDMNGENALYLTIEGNSNDEGNREGYEVCRLHRRLDDPRLLGFINY